MPRKSPDVRLLAAVAGIALASAALAAAPPAIKTPAEDCGYTRYTQNGDIGRFLSLSRRPLEGAFRPGRRPDEGRRRIPGRGYLPGRPLRGGGGAAAGPRPEETDPAPDRVPARQRAIGQGGRPLAHPRPRPRAR